MLRYKQPPQPQKCPPGNVPAQPVRARWPPRMRPSQALPPKVRASPKNGWGRWPAFPGSKETPDSSGTLSVFLRPPGGIPEPEIGGFRWGLLPRRHQSQRVLSLETALLASPPRVLEPTSCLFGRRACGRRVETVLASSWEADGDPTTVEPVAARLPSPPEGLR
mmetsp:Transcript_25137/g.58510  ORF Transcript_25137/g.58510 Transcript_25137/m.58510 type:complete len:164 (-) Transcript_25137:82-573(-)